MKTQLKIKIKSLAAEAKIIRAEEQKWRTPSGPHPMFWSLREHRKGTNGSGGAVRSESRHSLLAYGFLRGRTYAQMEAWTWDKGPDFGRVEAIALRFGGLKSQDIKQKFERWLQEAKAYRESGVRPPRAVHKGPKPVWAKNDEGKWVKQA